MMRFHMGDLKSFTRKSRDIIRLRSGIVSDQAHTDQPTAGFTRSHTYHTFYTNIYIYSGSKLRDMLQCISIVFSVSTSAAVTGA